MKHPELSAHIRQISGPIANVLTFSQAYMREKEVQMLPLSVTVFIDDVMLLCRMSVVLSVLEMWREQ